MSVERCYSAVQRHVAAHPERSREDVLQVMQSFPSCQTWTRDRQERILQTAFAPREERGERPVPQGYMRASPDALRLQHERFWRGFLLIGTLLLILGSVLYFSLPATNKTKTYILIAFVVLAVTYVCVGIWRTLKRHGVAGFGRSVSHIFASEDAMGAPRAPSAASSHWATRTSPPWAARSTWT